MVRPMMTQSDMRQLLIDAIEKAGSMSEFARNIGVSKQFIAQIVSDNKDITDRIACALGYERVVETVSYIPIKRRK